MDVCVDRGKNRWSVRLDQTQLTSVISNGYTAGYIEALLKKLELLDLLFGVLGTRDSLGIF